MTRAFIGAGSNIDPERHLAEAVRLLGAAAHIRAISTVYLTAPLDRPDQPSYYNCVVEIETALPPLELKGAVLRRIEAELGRRRGKDKFASRPIDLDLVLYGDVTMAEEELTLPDPEILRRPFLAVPLAELAPELTLPGSKLTLSEIASRMQQSGMTPLAAYSDRLKRGIHT
ncbi:MAG TPA: 2-amino-4-hydroxy-6-hydroxymethyldihydropteridine diphosphokinase [Nitrospirota bacterium]